MKEKVIYVEKKGEKFEARAKIGENKIGVISQNKDYSIEAVCNSLNIIEQKGYEWFDRYVQNRKDDDSVIFPKTLKVNPYEIIYV